MRIDIYKTLKNILIENKEPEATDKVANLADDSSTSKDGQKDVSNLFICVYDDIHVDLFEKIDVNINCKRKCYDAGSIFKGVYSDIIGIKKTHDGDSTCNHWEFPGTRVTTNGNVYVANCRMQESMSFEAMRLILYSYGAIDSYNPGKATSQEIIDVLKYAVTYYQLDNNRQKIKS